MLSPLLSPVTSLLFPHGANTLVSTFLDSVLAVYQCYSGTIQALSLISTSRPVTTAAALLDGRVVISSTHKNFIACVGHIQTRRKIWNEFSIVTFCRESTNSKDPNKNDDDEIKGVCVAHAIQSVEGLLVALTDHFLFTIHASHGSDLRLTSYVICSNLEEVYNVGFLQPSD